VAEIKKALDVLQVPICGCPRCKVRVAPLDPLRLEDRKENDSQAQEDRKENDSQAQALQDIEGEVEKEEGAFVLEEEDETLFRAMEQCMDNFRQARVV
jgi:hypothetical protein